VLGVLMACRGAMTVVNEATTFGAAVS
jgi:hypothetical protein